MKNMAEFSLDICWKWPLLICFGSFGVFFLEADAFQFPTYTQNVSLASRYQGQQKRFDPDFQN